MKTVIVIGGGLSGLLTAIQLANAGIACQIIERKRFPMHRVCGEYISNETVPFLRSLGLYPEELRPSAIREFQLTSVNGKSVILPLDSGGFGISRYSFDYFLYQKAIAAGVSFLLDTEVEKINLENDRFIVSASGHNLSCDVLVGAFGKRSKIDVVLGRSFIRKRSPYVGVKYHLRTDHPAELIALHNFFDGYCGISNIEDGKTNLCYLTHSDNLKKYGNIRRMEEAVLFRNPFIKSIFEKGDFLFDKPETINEISFETKQPVEGHILMTGDAAGMITPLCGNGMAMAIHSSKILSSLLIPFCKTLGAIRSDLERNYTKRWKTEFSMRLWTGRQIQRLFGSEVVSDLLVGLAQAARPVAKLMIRGTHGEPF